MSKETLDQIRLHTYTREDTNLSPDVMVYQIIYDARDISVVSELPENIKIDHDVEKVEWLHIVGVNDLPSLTHLLKPFGIHPLVIEDLLVGKQRTKIEDYDDYLFFIGHVFKYEEDSLVSDQVGMILGDHFLITLQNKPLGVFSNVRQRLIESKGILRKKGADFLAYTLLDCLIDDYFIGFEQFNEKVELIDERIFNDENYDNILLEVHGLKQDVVKFRRVLMPLNDSFNQIMRGDFPFFKDDTKIFIRDVYDHTSHLVESLASTKENLSSIMDLYLSNQSNKLNIQMRILTVVTIMFMPLTLIVGIYGMNFESMPELKWRYGYFVILGIMVAISGLLGWIFYKKHWF